MQPCVWEDIPEEITFILLDVLSSEEDGDNEFLGVFIIATGSIVLD